MWIPHSSVISFILLLSYATESTAAANPEATSISRPNNGGTLACASENNPTWQQGDDNYFMSLVDATSIQFDFCRYLYLNPLELQEHAGTRYVYNASSSFTWKSADPNWDRIWVAITGDSHEVDDGGKSVECRSHLNINSAGWKDACQGAMSTIINGCDLVKHSDSDYWKAGGTFTKACTTWQLYKTGSFL